MLLAAILCSTVISAFPAAAAPDNGTLSMQVENDFFTPGNKDRHYTNGLRLDWLPTPSPADDQGFVERAARALPFIGDLGSAQHVGWTLGQSLFTPQNTQTTAALPKDRPYAGWLYAGLTLIKNNKADPEALLSLDEIDTLEFDLGVVGRAALGQQVQRNFHRWAFSNEDPKGWKHQLKSEPGLLISYDHKWRALAQANIGHLGIDFTPSVGGDLGNVQIDASAGAMLRVGRDLPADYGPPRIRPGLSGSNYFLSDSDSGRRFGWYLFGGVEGRAVARNIFLDGNSFADSQSVEKKTFVADIQAGVALIVYGVRLTVTEVVRTQEFVGQRGDDAFGAVSASFNF